MKHIKLFNESIKDVLKPKSNQEILDSIKDLPDHKKMINACKHHMTWLVKKLVDDGVDPSFNNNMCLINCGILDYKDIVDILIKNEKVIKQLYLTQLNIHKENYSEIYSTYDEEYGEDDYETEPYPHVDWNFDNDI